MITKEQRIRLLIFLAFSIVLLVLIFGLFIMPKIRTVGDVYYVDFRETSVTGITVGADVKYQGVVIGKVIRMEVNPNDLRSVLIYIRITKGFTIKEDMRAALQYAGITGLRFVEISGGTIGAKNLAPGEKILPKKGLGEKAEDIVLNVDSIVDGLNNILNTENQEKIALTLKNVEKSTNVIAGLLEKRRTSLSNAMVNLDTITAQLSSATSDLNNFVNHMQGLVEKINPDRIDKLVTLTEAILQDLSKRTSDQEMGKLIADIDTFMRTSNNSIRKVEEGVLSMEEELNKSLMRLRQSIDNIAKFTRDVREDPTLFIRKRPAKKE
ncbi:MAG TPA: MlaD family protein [Candidatus Deferrimicrobium sp.]|nr:MlaD family protein [Candidatus Deferrimicrobium sp.]